MIRDSPVRRGNGQPEFGRQPARKRTEKMLRDAFRCGRPVDLRPDGKAARNGRAAARRAVVPAEMITAVLSTDPGPGCARLELRGARITGPLDLSYARIEPAIALRDCVFDEPIVLAEARLGALALDGSEFPGIEAPNLEVNSDLGLSRVRSSRTVNLTGAHFDRDVRLRGAHLSHGDDQEVALAADHLVVDGSVTCDGGFEAAGTVTMAGARVNGAVRLNGARITADGEQMVAFYGDGMTVGHDFSADGLAADGEVRLIDVNIASTLELHGARLTNGSGVALRLDRAEILSSLYCDDGFRAVGDIAAIGIHVKGSVFLNQAEIGRPPAASADRPEPASADRPGPASGTAEPEKTGVALCLVRATIGGDLGCWEDFVAHGTIDLSRLTVAGEFTLETTGLGGSPTAADLTNGRFATLAITGTPPPGQLDFTKAKTDFFRDGPVHRETGAIILDEFEYNSIQMTNVTVEQREEWLLRAMRASQRKLGGDEDGYLPQPYDQLAEAYRRAGNDHDARRIQLAKWRQRNRVTGWDHWYSKLWNILQDVVIGYGYAPMRALGWLFGLFVLGVLLFRYETRPIPISGMHGTFTLNNSVGYTIDLILPTSALDERQVWQSSNGLGEVAAASLVIFGWLLTATVFTAAARVLQRN
jgi:hypothetical protein